MRALFLLGWLLAGIARAATGSQGAALPAPAPPLQPLVGRPSSDLVEPGDTLLDVAFRHRLGFEAVRRLNPQLDVWIPDPGTVVRLPTQAILPDAPQEGLVINVPEMRLYDFTAESGPEILSVAVGDATDPTLLGSFHVGAKRTDPAWNVPESIQLEKPELPPVVLPGPDNPLGSRWMTIGATSYGIHGTNNRWSIGREATHGCVRLYEDEMQRLFDRVPSGTPLRIVYQPVKWGRDGGRLFVEVHPDRYAREAEPLATAMDVLAAHGLAEAVDRPALERALEEARGVPTDLGPLPVPSEEDEPGATCGRPC